MNLRSRVTTDPCILRTKTVVQKWGDITLWHHGSRPTPGEKKGDTYFFTRDVVPTQWLSIEIGWQPVFYSCRPNSLTEHRPGVTDPFLASKGSVQWPSTEQGWQPVYNYCSPNSMAQYGIRVTGIPIQHFLMVTYIRGFKLCPILFTIIVSIQHWLMVTDVGGFKWRFNSIHGEQFGKTDKGNSNRNRSLNNT